MTAARRRSNVAARHRLGVTLIEVMISIALVATVLLVSLTASSNLLRNQHERRDNSVGQELAHQMLDEVTAMAFRDRSDPVFGLESDELAGDRSTFDDVDDYDGYSASPPTYRDGTLIAGYAGWTLTVSIVPAIPDAAGIVTSGADENSPLRNIRVQCTSPDGAAAQSETTVADVPQDLDQTASFESWRRIKLSFPDRDVNVTAPMRNLPSPTY